MPSRNINLTEHYDEYLSKALASGRYKNASEIVRAGLHLLERQDAEDEAKLEALRMAFKEGEDDIERGDYVTLDSDADIDRFFDAISAEVGRSG